MWISKKPQKAAEVQTDSSSTCFEEKEKETNNKKQPTHAPFLSNFPSFSILFFRTFFFPVCPMHAHRKTDFVVLFDLPSLQCFFWGFFLGVFFFRFFSILACCSSGDHP
jgi:hypothetical protein